MIDVCRTIKLYDTVVKKYFMAVLYESVIITRAPHSMIHSIKGFSFEGQYDIWLIYMLCSY